MAGPDQNRARYPFTSFNFAVELSLPDKPQLCSAAFAECDGLEVTMDVKTIREGGSNDRQIRMAGALSYGQLSLKRGMTETTDLWDWFEAVRANPRLRAQGEVVLLGSNGSDERARFILSRCLPVKLKAPALNAKDGTVAIEELQVAYESLSLKPRS